MGAGRRIVSVIYLARENQLGINSNQATPPTNIRRLVAAATRNHRSLMSMESPLQYSKRTPTLRR
jgi:hypothetical protein